MSASRRRLPSNARRVVLGVAVVLACTPLRGGWDLADLERREPQLARHSGHRLGDVPPHFVPDADGVVLFLCRWVTPARLAVSLPPEADARERAVLARALGAWQDAGLGLSFEITEPGSAQIELRFADEARDGWAPAGSGETVSDCLVAGGRHSGDVGSRSDAVDAQLVFASIYLRRTSRDLLGRDRLLSDEELLAVALHELGHALGHAGHAARGGSLMEAAPEQARRAARRVLAGTPLAEPGLAALYDLASGTRVGRIRIPAESAGALDGIRARARQAGWRGPFARVGDDDARLLWRDGTALAAAVDVPGWRDVVAGRARFVVASGRPSRQEPAKKQEGG